MKTKQINEVKGECLGVIYKAINYGFNNAKHMEQCYTKFEFEQNEIRKEFENEN